MDKQELDRIRASIRKAEANGEPSSMAVCAQASRLVLEVERIQHLHKELLGRCWTLAEERDAAIADLKDEVLSYGDACALCAKSKKCRGKLHEEECNYGDNWEWRGVGNG